MTRFLIGIYLFPDLLLPEVKVVVSEMVDVLREADHLLS